MNLQQLCSQVAKLIEQAAQQNAVGDGRNENEYNQWYDALINAVEDGLNSAHQRTFPDYWDTDPFSNSLH